MRLGDLNKAKNYPVNKHADFAYLLAGDTMPHRLTLATLTDENGVRALRYIPKDPTTGLGATWGTNNPGVARAAAQIIGGSIVSKPLHTPNPSGFGGGGTANMADIAPQNSGAEAPQGKADDAQGTPKLRPEGASQSTDEGTGDGSGGAGDGADGDGAEGEVRHDLHELTARELGQIAKLLTRRGQGIGNVGVPTAQEKATGTGVKGRYIGRFAAKGYANGAEQSQLVGDAIDAGLLGAGSTDENAPGAGDDETQAPTQTPKPPSVSMNQMLKEAPQSAQEPQADPFDADALDDEFSKRQAQAIREAIEGASAPSELDEDRVREIAREEAGAGDAAVLETVSGTLKEAEAKLQSIVGQALDEATQRAQALGSTLAAPVSITVKIAALPAVVLNNTHFLAPKVAALASVNLNVLLVGPPASGKSTVAKHVAQMLGVRFVGRTDLSGETTTGELVGRVMPVGGGRFFSTLLLEGYENGGLWMADELDTTDPSVGVRLNGMLIDTEAFVEARTIGNLDARILRAKNFYALGGANTFGHGQTGGFTSRNALDAAFLDRWYTQVFGYDAHIVAMLCGASGALKTRVQAPWTPETQPQSQNERNALQAWFWEVADATQVGFGRTWSPRVLQRITAARSVGVRLDEAIADQFASWKPAELKKLGALANGPVFSNA